MRYVVTLFFLIGTFESFAQYHLVKEQFINEHTTEKACHASTIVELSPNRLMAAWFAGEHESNPNVCIWLSSAYKNKWTKARKVADGIFEGKQYACWNPVLVKNKHGKLFLFYKVGPNPREWWGMMKSSVNEGKTWSKAIKLPNNMLGPIRNKSIQLSDGHWLHPSSTESINDNVWQSHLEISDANAKNWEKVAIDCGTYGVIQPSILVHKGEILQMLFRSKQNRIIQSWSIDKGKSWGALTPTNLPNPNSGIDAVMLKDGSFILIYNPLLAGKDWSDGRNILKVAHSKDGINWTDIYELEHQAKGEFSYPAVIQGSNGEIHITYTFDRKKIKHVVLRANGL